MPKKDFTQVAFAVVQAAIGDAPKPMSGKQLKARNAGLKGGKGRMAKLTDAEGRRCLLRARQPEKGPRRARPGPSRVPRSVEQGQLAWIAAAMLADAFEPAEPDSRVLSDMDAARVHTVHLSSPSSVD